MTGWMMIRPAFIQHVRQCPSCYDDLEVNYTVMAVIRLLEDEDESLDLSRQLVN